MNQPQNNSDVALTLAEARKEVHGDELYHCLTASFSETGTQYRVAVSYRESSASANVGRDPAVAVLLFRKLSRASVFPETLDDILEDLSWEKEMLLS